MDNDRRRQFRKELHGSVESLLREAGVYALDAHGWLNADDVDPKHIGHAMAQIGSLAGEVIDAHSADPPKAFPLTACEKKMIVAQAEFEGLMNASRIAIGQMLFAADIDGELAAHFMSAMLLLSAASDRLRDFFVCAVFKRSPDKWKPADHQTGARIAFAKPFDDARTFVRDVDRSQLQASIKALPPLARAIARHRRSRHVIAHQIATAEGRRHLRLVDRKPVPVNYNIDWASID